MAEPTTLETKPPGPVKIPINFQLGEKLIDSAMIKPATFASFADCIAAAHRMTQPPAFSARLLRVRMSRQVNYHIKGATVSIMPEEALRLPLPDFYKIVAGLDPGQGTPGKIIRDGNGIDTAITFELGTPIPQGAGKELA